MFIERLTIVSITFALLLAFFEFSSIGVLFIVTSHFAILPFSVVTVIVVVPTFFPVILPDETVAIEESDDFQVYEVSEFVGETDGVNVFEYPTYIVNVLGNDTDAGRGRTTMSAVALIPLSVVAVTIASPSAIPLTIPLELTVAILLLEDSHVTFLQMHLLENKKFQAF